MLVALLAFIGAANAVWSGVLVAFRTPDVLRSGVPGRDLTIGSSLALVGVILAVHGIRRLSTQDPPPRGEPRLIAALLMVAHGTLLLLDIAGLIDGPPGTDDVPPNRHVLGLLLGAAMLTSSNWLRRARRRDEPA